MQPEPVILTLFVSTWQRDDHLLTDQQLTVNEGQNPFPIYVAINLKEDYSAQDFKGKVAIIMCLFYIYWGRITTINCTIIKYVNNFEFLLFANKTFKTCLTIQTIQFQTRFVF